MVIRATARASKADNANIHQLIWVRNAKSFNHLFIAHQATGAAMIKDMKYFSLGDKQMPDYEAFIIKD
jgi:hypothetical protein